MAHYEVNESGDIIATVDGDRRTPFDPAEFGWLRRGGANDVGSERRSVASLRAIPGITTEVTDIDRLAPGPRPKRSQGWLKWPDGHAPPAYLMSKGGMEASHGGRDSTGAYFDRLTEAAGQVARHLPAAADRSPMVIYDFVSGRRIEVHYEPSSVAPGGDGTVYLLEDGAGIKIGWTSGTVAQRISGLQTGNPRTIIQMAEIIDAGLEVEAHLHGQLGHLHLSGEWFQRGPIVADVAGAGGLAAWLRSKLPPDRDWKIIVHPPYA